MTHIAFVSCSKLKAARPAPAAALYTSALFRKSLLSALTSNKETYILSAKYGVLSLSEKISPYDVTLSNMARPARQLWSQKVGSQLSGILSANDVATLYCGNNYFSPIEERFSQLDCEVHLPLHNLSLGQRLQSLRRQNGEEVLESMMSRFRTLMFRLYIGQSGGRTFQACSGQLQWPARGVYFIMDHASACFDRPNRKGFSRIIRVGTHAVSSGSQSTLWNRLSTHRGTNSGTGSHRSSIFRSHVGRAIVANRADSTAPATWGIGQNASADIRESEAWLERLVSSTIGHMRLIWLNVNDSAGPTSDRAYLERNAIGLLSRSYMLSPDSGQIWLGDASPNYRIALSGLWNLDHLFSRPDPDFLDVLEEYVKITLSGNPASTRSLAPKNWHNARSSSPAGIQPTLF